VSGGIFAHNIDAFHGLFPFLPSLVTELLIGLVVGFMCLLLVNLALKLKKQLIPN
jgi:hypothetical protein